MTFFIRLNCSKTISTWEMFSIQSSNFWISCWRKISQTFVVIEVNIIVYRIIIIYLNARWHSNSWWIVCLPRITWNTWVYWFCSIRPCLNRRISHYRSVVARRVTC